MVMPLNEQMGVGAVRCGIMDESGERKCKCFSGTTKQEVNKKMTAYIEDFNNQVTDSIEANKTRKDSMTNWLQVFKFPSVEHTTTIDTNVLLKTKYIP